MATIELIEVEPASKMIEVAKNSTPNAIFFNEYPEKLSIAGNVVDLVFSTMSFHHWNNHQKSIKEIGRILKTNGYFILGDVTTPRWFTWLT